MFSENLLGLPQEKFGLPSIYIGNIISKEVERQDKGFKAQYNLNKFKAQYNLINNKITILNTSDLPPSVLNKIRYGCPTSPEYDKWIWYPKYDKGVWYPVVEKERNKDRNLEVDFSCSKLGVDHSQMYSTRSNSIDLMYFHSRRQSLMIMDSYSGLESFEMMMPSLSLQPSSRRPSFKLPSVELEEDILDSEEVASMEKSISEGIINAMSQFLNKHEKTKGIWYPNDYKKYLMDEFDIEMDESFYTGFANEKFFEKTGRFTFKLKNGEKASEALLSFLEGPTVADCGNATMACYYKCVLDVVGKDKFDELFSSKPFLLTIGQYGITDEKSPISYLAEYTKASKKMTTGILGKRPLEIGQECHFDGIIWYGNKHPEGFGGGWNVIYIGNNEEGQQLFMAHGFEKPLTENEINQKLIELYNRERTPQDEQHVIQAKKPKLYDRETNGYLIYNYTISDREIEETPNKFIKGFLVGSIRGLQVNELLKLKNAETVDLFKLKLMNKKVSSFSESMDYTVTKLSNKKSPISSKNIKLDLKYCF